MAPARWVWLGGACAIVCGLAAGGWLLAQERAPQAVPALRPSLPPQPAETPVRAARSEYGARARSVPAPAAPAPAFRVEVSEGIWRIRAASAPRHEVARELAELSRTELRNGVDALRTARPLSLRWEGHDLAQAWQAVIGGEASYALQCGAGRCAAWIIGSTRAEQKAEAAVLRMTAAPYLPAAAALAVERSSPERSGYD